MTGNGNAYYWKNSEGCEVDGEKLKAVLEICSLGGMLFFEQIYV